MSDVVSALIYVMAIGTVLLDAALIVKILALFHRSSREKIFHITRHYGVLAVFVLSLLAIAGTLIMQFAGDLTPCVLCWWQRVFMYPIALISFIALVKETELSEIADYVIWLSILGGVFALYQHLLQILPTGALIPCDPTNDCAVRSVFDFGFVTIPWMALTVFFALGLIAVLGKQKAKH